jgi:methylated-DNA-protein-cysteine methyltransferase-like protein
MRQATKRRSERPGDSPGRWERVWAVVRRIPRGRVATYGQVAALAGLGRQARQVGYALHALPGEGFAPWHRVVNARGAISLLPGAGADVTQRLRLEREGVRFDARGRIDLECYGWQPVARASRRLGRPAVLLNAAAPSPPSRASASPRSGAPPAGARGRPRR